MADIVSAGSALPARPRTAIGELVVSINQKDQAPARLKLRQLRRVKGVVEPLVKFAPGLRKAEGLHCEPGGHRLRLWVERHTQ